MDVRGVGESSLARQRTSIPPGLDETHLVSNVEFWTTILVEEDGRSRSPWGGNMADTFSHDPKGGVLLVLI